MRKSDKTLSDQKLSQLIDGEWFDLDPAKCVATLCADSELRDKWSRYHIIRDAIRGESMRSDQALANRICAAVRNEATYTNITEFSPVRQASVSEHGSEMTVAGDAALPTRNTRLSWLRTGVVGSALAASVALVTVVGLNYTQRLDSSADTTTLAASGIARDAGLNIQADTRSSTTQLSASESKPVDSTLPNVEFVSNTGSYWVSTDSATRAKGEEQLNMMLSLHLESSPTVNRDGLLSYSQLVGYDEKPVEP